MVSRSAGFMDRSFTEFEGAGRRQVGMVRFPTFRSDSAQGLASNTQDVV